MFPSLGIFSIPIMAFLVLSDITLGTPMWYINPPAKILASQPKPYHALTLVTAPIPPPPQLEPTLVVKASSEGYKAKKNEPKDNTPKAPKPTPLCTLCEVVGQATNNSLELPHLKPLVHETFPESNVAEVQATLPGPA